MSTADAVSREAAWLGAALQQPTGPFDLVQAYWPRTPATRQAALYVLRAHLVDERWANQRKLTTYEFRLRAIWPVGVTTTAVGIAEAEQQTFDSAIDTLLNRIRGSLGDHSHGGAFLSVAEAPGPAPRVDVRFDDPEVSIAAASVLRAEITYHAQDQSVI